MKPANDNAPALRRIGFAIAEYLLWMAGPPLLAAWLLLAW